ncbi:uncharacterized protein MICPUCDRAFT_50018 [Micromonas pusilla CCMP1545]|jgi:hypothetical protein|uniref:Predicted protein n=1 Tax=Micromonas pusilla (strain CCMP1545) TaxID=564608 RepID=C1MH18_MICPC|nr:uncharacterized protein MICPUCDRAFT_50018 [Micromonas pusilla CCMP1545]EEH60668.1 predicted protein [Micromonas pusilla CCMP1545]|tara:strand:+ start:175 stop:459 length:285 start_codon:yes stop_codon:yes gene_type:complete|eukprot:XP_003055416.1 predicted protein [Micromonas pusilla CCMP1545]
MVRWGRGIGGGPSAGFLQYVPAWVVLAVCLAAVLAFAYGLSKVKSWGYIWRKIKTFGDPQPEDRPFEREDEAWAEEGRARRGHGGGRGEGGNGA